MIITEYWQPDKETYDELQQLRAFLSFVANLKEATPKDKEAAEKIDAFIINIDKIETKREWNICLDIFDYEIQMGLKDEEGIYHRRWWVFFEDYEYCLNLEAETTHSKENLFSHFGDDYSFKGEISFRKEITWERKVLTSSIKDFAEDAKNYKQYMNEKMENIEVDIEFK